MLYTVKRRVCAVHLHQFVDVDERVHGLALVRGGHGGGRVPLALAPRRREVDLAGRDASAQQEHDKQQQGTHDGCVGGAVNGREAAGRTRAPSAVSCDGGGRKRARQSSGYIYINLRVKNIIHVITVITCCGPKRWKGLDAQSGRFKENTSFTRNWPVSRFVWWSSFRLFLDTTTG